MKLKNQIIILLLLVPACFGGLFAQSSSKNKNVDLTIFLGVNLGATAPLPLPAEVRKIESYNMKFNPLIGANMLYKFDGHWGAGVGLLLETKGMRVKDEVKYMYTSVMMTENDKDDRLTGYFVGNNTTNVSMTYMTVPIYANYRFNDKWSAKLGVYASKATSSKFYGDVSDGYLRVETPTGQKVKIDKAEFDFSNDVRDYDFGLLAGGEYNLTQHVGVYANLSWGLLPFFYTKTNPIKFKMNNIYASIGLSYTL